MKKYCLSAIVILFSTLSFGQKKYEMVVKKTDGTETVIKTDDIDQTFFREYTPPESFLSCPDNNHPHLIDLGFGPKWACCDVGASAPEQYGGLYAWGETEEKNSYSWWNYQHAFLDELGFRNIINLGNISGTEYDVAHVKWGGSWRMPTYSELLALNDSCTKALAIINDQHTTKFTGPNGGAIYMPNNGFFSSGHFFQGEFGEYWSSIPDVESNNSYYISVSDNGLSFGWGPNNRYLGLSIRPVSD